MKRQRNKGGRADRLLADVIKVCRQPPRTRSSAKNTEEGENMREGERDGARGYRRGIGRISGRISHATRRRALSIRLLNVVEMSTMEIRDGHTVPPDKVRRTVYGEDRDACIFDFAVS